MRNTRNSTTKAKLLLLVITSSPWLLPLCARAPAQPADVLRFTRGQYPLQLEPATLRVRAEDRLLNGASAECRSCHTTAYDNWKQSRHRVAFSNELYQESHHREPSAWCLNCHAPLMQSGGQVLEVRHRLQKEDGISCNVCHVRDNRILTSRLPDTLKSKPAHDYTEIPELAQSKFCENCHEFNFPTTDSLPVAGDHFRYSTLPMQATYSEWLGSGFQNGTCQACHLGYRAATSHRFPGGHDQKMLAQSLRVEIERIDDSHILVRIVALGIGHAFPTGDLFRTLRLTLRHGQSVSRELFFGKQFQNVPQAELKPDGANKFLHTDNTIPAPAPGEHLSFREVVVPWPVSASSVAYELYLEYLHPHNALVSQLPPSMTKKLIFRSTQTLRTLPADKSKG